MRDTWAQAVERHTALLDAHSRLASDARPQMHDHGEPEVVNAGGVWKISASTIEPPA